MNTGSPAAQNVAILLIEQFSMMSFACTVEPLREANWILNERVYNWRVYSQDGGPVLASNGLSMNVHDSIAHALDSPMVIVCSSFDPQKHVSASAFKWLRRLARQGAMMGAVETGAWILARAGLLNGYRATIHWENRASIAETFPDVILSNNIFEIDRKRFTASGAAAAMDMMLHIIRERHGASTATAIAEEFIYNRIRAAEAPQRVSVAERFTFNNKTLRRLIERLDSQLERRITVADLARSAGISDRQVQRLFTTYLKTTPQAYHRSLRLRRARDMLRQTELSVLEIAIASGFSSASDFSRAYRRTYQRAPVADRTLSYSSHDP